VATVIAAAADLMITSQRLKVRQQQHVKASFNASLSMTFRLLHVVNTQWVTLVGRSLACHYTPEWAAPQQSSLSRMRKSCLHLGCAADKDLFVFTRNVGVDGWKTLLLIS